MKAERDLWVRWYCQRWRKSRRVQMLTPAQRGIYFEALMIEEEQGFLPANFRLTAMLMHIEHRDLKAAWPAIQGFFHPVTINGEDGYQSTVMQEVIAIRNRGYDARVKAAESTNAKRGRSTPPTDTVTVPVPDTPTASQTEHGNQSGNRALRASLSKSKSGSKSKRSSKQDILPIPDALNPAPTTIELPTWLSPADWQRFLDYRRDLDRRPLSLDAQRTNLRKLTTLRDQGNDPIAVIDRTIAAGTWKGFFALPVDYPSRQNSHTSQPSVSVRESPCPSVPTTETLPPDLQPNIDHPLYLNAIAPYATNGSKHFFDQLTYRGTTPTGDFVCTTPSQLTRGWIMGNYANRIEETTGRRLQILIQEEEL